MFANTFPLVYLVKNHLKKAVDYVGAKMGRIQMGMTSSGATGFPMVFANIIATYHISEEMRPRDLALRIAFAVCAQAALGDHLAFTANFQPTMIVAILVGKLIGGTFAVLLAMKISMPAAVRLKIENGDWPPPKVQAA
jgi:ethanolamine transporter